MKKQELFEQEQEAFLKYRNAVVEGRNLIAMYWHKKFKKYADIIFVSFPESENT